MSFAIRFISTTGAGREIVRAAAFDGDAITIGRGTDNDIVLADLAALPSHARLVHDGDRVVVEAIGGEPVVVDGRPRQRYEVSLARSAVLRIGNYRLALAQADDEATVAITVRRETAAALPDERRAFALIGRLPGKRAMAWTAVAVLLALFLAWPIWSFGHRSIGPLAGVQADRSWSAGPLSPAHAALERNCKACHVGAFVAVKDQACASCHADVHAHADPARMAAAQAGLTGFALLRQKAASAFGRPPGRCADCHVEHRGAQGMMVADQRFCSDCHAALAKRLPDTAIGNADDFARVHPQFRPAVATSPEGHGVRRIPIDAHPRENNGLIFPHALHLAAGGGVARMAMTMGRGPVDCAGCHRADPDGRGFAPVSMERDCEGCHSLAYAKVGRTFLRLQHGDTAQVIAQLTQHGGAGAARAAFTRGGACFDCHLIQPPGAGRATWRVVPVRQPARYLVNGWFDHASHRGAACSDCHAAKQSTRASDVLIPGIATCRGCHSGAKAAPPLVRSSCVLCHDYHRSDAAPRATRRRGHTITAAAEMPPLRLDWQG